ncbi:hypothetical protein IWZ00DRAFT_7237 [Phyllosticta capitalensis]
MSSPDQTNMNPFSRNKLRLKPEAAAGRQASWQQKRRHVRASHLFLPNAASAPQGGGRVEPDQGPGTLPRSPHQSVWLENRQHESLPTESPTHTYTRRQRENQGRHGFGSIRLCLIQQATFARKRGAIPPPPPPRARVVVLVSPPISTNQPIQSIHPSHFKIHGIFRGGCFPVLSLSSNDEEKKKKKKTTTPCTTHSFGFVKEDFKTDSKYETKQVKNTNENITPVNGFLLSVMPRVGRASKGRQASVLAGPAQPIEQRTQISPYDS